MKRWLLLMGLLALPACDVEPRLQVAPRICRVELHPLLTEQMLRRSPKWNAYGACPP